MNINKRWLNRREFITLMNVALASFILAPWQLKAANSTILRKIIPGTSESLPVIGLGSSRTFDVNPNAAVMTEFVALMRDFFTLGGELIDSSPMYGAAEQIIGKLLTQSGGRDRLFAATKVWTNGEQAGIQQMESSAKKWGVDRFDLIQIHNLRDWQTQLKTLKAWKSEGKLRYLGITTSHGRNHRELETILRQEPFDFVQLSYNIEDRTIENRLLPIAADRGIAVLVNRPYQRGSLFRAVKGKPLPEWAAEFDCQSWGQFFLKYIVSHPAVTCVIPATTKRHHLQDNMAAGIGRQPDATQRKDMEKFISKLLY
ncbi:Aldo/keto reductase [Desulfuromusa kysingii]|uniref:Aldo/keto reductase n=1 Tax=Desulfuromusa kysingii TaxID=37625 RepID=A0A1H4DTA7_9BACT|nr:aldo/keto reductase [Desulfuromusa kysingii]SEA75422.1 Aldo/keto reductase [Desulfuromusa kysingii]